MAKKVTLDFFNNIQINLEVEVQFEKNIQKYTRHPPSQKPRKTISNSTARSLDSKTIQKSAPATPLDFHLDIEFPSKNNQSKISSFPLSKWPKQIRIRPLNNLGNSCFLNCIVQLLITLSTIMELEFIDNCNIKKHFEALRIEYLEKDNDNLLSQSWIDFVNNFGNNYKDFRRKNDFNQFEQEDVSEVLVTVFLQNIASNIFILENLQKIFCNNCQETISYKEEMDNHISLPIWNPLWEVTNVEQIFDNYFESENISFNCRSVD